MTNKPLRDTANQLVKSPKGILAADESSKTCDKRFIELGIDTSLEKRRQYRQTLFTTPNFAKYISGVILFEETIHQKADNGESFVKILEQNKVLPGIKVDKGLVPLDNFPEEMYTEGLDGLSERFKEYSLLGAKFAKWRCVFNIDTSKKLPTSTAIHANLNSMARYASIAQTNGIVPIVEPEVLYDGNHTIEECSQVMSQVYRVLFDLLVAYKVDMKAVILKTSMSMAGKANKEQSTSEEVASHTLEVFSKRVPTDIAGIVFLSGGQTPQQATSNLNAIESMSKLSIPITFSFSRALQEPALKAWLGKSKNVKNAQNIFEKYLKQNSNARLGKL